MANWFFDPSQYEEQKFDLIPVGNHRVRIAEVVEKKFKSGNDGFEITLTVSGYASKLWFYLVLDPNNVQLTNQRLGEFFNCFGITNPMLGNGAQWVGLVGAVRVKHEEYNGENNAKVAYCINRKDQEKLPPWEGTAPTASAPAMSAPTINPNDLPFDM